MARATRSFRLALSPEGLSLLIDAHCHLVRTTRCLLSWGASLHIAVRHLDALPVERIAAKLEELPGLGLIGIDCHHVGAPAALAERAALIARRLDDHRAGLHDRARLGDIYVVALKEAAAAPVQTLLTVHQAMASDGTGRSKFRI